MHLWSSLLKTQVVGSLDPMTPVKAPQGIWPRRAQSARQAGGKGRSACERRLPDDATYKLGQKVSKDREGEGPRVGGKKLLLQVL